MPCLISMAIHCRRRSQDAHEYSDQCCGRLRSTHFPSNILRIRGTQHPVLSLERIEKDDHSYSIPVRKKNRTRSVSCERLRDNLSPARRTFLCCQHHTLYCSLGG